MTWVRLSDKTADEEALNEAGWAAELLWYKMLPRCAAVNDGAGHDGLVTPFLLRTTAALSSKPIPYKKAAPVLVSAGLWHDSETVRGCSECMEQGGGRVTPGDYLIHEWWTHLMDAKGKTDPVHRWRDLRKKDLNRKPALKAQVRKRDRDLCRYCGELTRWDGDRKSSRAGTYDHEDPFCRDGDGGFGNTAKNLVVACRACNGRKKDRTPAQAGMELRPEPGPYQVQIKSDQVQDPGPITDQPAADQVQINGSRGPARETGRDQVGTGSEPGSGPDVDLIGAGQARGPVSTPSSNGHTSTNGVST